MFRIENIHRITKYFLFCVLMLFHPCFAQDEIVQTSRDDERFFQFSASRRPQNSEESRATDYEQNFGLQTDGQYYQIVFFVVFGIGLTVFIALLIVCHRVAKVFEGINTPSSETVTGATVHTPNIQATYTSRVPDEVGISVSYVNSAYSSGPSAVDRSGSDRPPDYTTVATIDGINRNASFPQVVTKYIETPPPKYEDGPVFQ